MILSCSSLTKSFLGQDVLKDITFKVDKHDKIAIIGVNGAGKSTLLHILTNEIPYDNGTLSINKNTNIGYLSQEHIFDLNKSIYETLEEPFLHLKKIEERMRELELLMASSHNYDDILVEYDALSKQYDHENGYEMTSQIKGVLKGLNFSEDMWDKPMGILSGGQKTRVGLGQLLLSKPDLLILDEPTNHLDLTSIQWLENYLKNYNNALIVVSHDRYFVDQVSNTIMEIENGKSTIYKCKYNQYASIKKHNRDVELKHYLNNQKEIKRMQKSIDTLKSYNREKQVKRAESKEKALAKMEKVDKPASLPSSIRIAFTPEVESGNDVLQIKDLAMSFDKPLFENITFDILKGEKVALIGPNGIGKTTLFHLILNDYKPRSGHIKLGVKVMIGYYDQEQTSLTFSNTIFEEIHNAYPLMTNTEIRNICACFLFTGDDVFKTIENLSGGEKGRVILIKLLLNKSNFLILDEPTNHLDTQSQEILEDALLDFPGTILFISHDRYFINKIATKIVEMSSNHSITYNGNYDYYLSLKEIPTKDKEVKQSSSKKQNTIDKKTKNKLKSLETSISKLEETIDTKNQLLSEDEFINDYEKYNALQNEINSLNEELENMLIEWEELQS